MLINNVLKLNIKFLFKHKPKKFFHNTLMKNLHKIFRKIFSITNMLFLSKLDEKYSR